MTRSRDETWGVLSAAFDEPELIDVVITVAGYKMVSIASNSLGVQLEPGLTGFRSRSTLNGY